MSFFGKVLNHLFNTVLVETLANSRTFQRFAVRINEVLTEMSKKGTERQQQLQQQAQEFTKTFREEMRKGLAEQGRQRQR
jgi:hypothetical protein